MTLTKETKSFNASGVFLQAYVLNQLKQRNWDTDIEYPVVVAPFQKNPKNMTHYWSGNPNKPTPQAFVNAIRDSQNAFDSSERSIDVISSRNIDDNRRINLCIECKKLNPKYSQWCFFDEKKEYVRSHLITKSINNGDAILFHAIETTGHSNPIYLSLTKKYSKDWGFLPEQIADYGLALTSQELKGEYFQTEQTVIDKACVQIIEGTYGYTLDTLISQLLTSEEFLTTDIFIPIIITNAKLRFCKFVPDKIDSIEGHLIEEPEYEDIDAIFYQYNSPKTVQYPEPMLGRLSVEQRKNISKWYVLVMSPKGFEEFLNKIDGLWGSIRRF